MEEHHSKAFCKKLIDDLMKPLGLKTRNGKVKSKFQNLHRRGIFLKDIKTGIICQVPCITNAFFMYLVCDSYEKLLKALQGARAFKLQHSLLSKANVIANPYFGYTIEEMLVARDLIGA